MQCIPRRAIMYLVVAKPTHRPFCLLQQRVSGRRLAWLPAHGVAKWHSVERHCMWYGCVGCSVVAYRWNIWEFEWSFRSRWCWIIKRETGELFCEWRACLLVSVSFAAWYLTVCSITCYLLLVDNGLCKHKFVLYFCFVTIFCTFCGPFY